MFHAPLLDPERLQPAVHAALRAWHRIGGAPTDLLDFLLLVQQQRATLTHSGDAVSIRLATNQTLMGAIDELAKQNKAEARVLLARFLDDNKTRTVANRQNVSLDQVNRLQRSAIRNLTQILLNQEMAAREARAQAVEAYFPPPTYDALFGLDHACQALFEQLLSPQAPWVVTIVGIGGIGKTALADAVARRLIRQVYFEETIWVRIPAQTMSGRCLSPELALEALTTAIAKRLWPEAAGQGTPADRLKRLRQALKTRPYLIIIDNLEMEADTAFLLQRLGDLAEPGKFLLTSRIRPSGQTGVFSFPLDELAFDDAAALLCHHAKTIGVVDLAEACGEEVQSIYQVTGGNPLAIKLVVSLADVLPLPHILADLREKRLGQVDDMYRHIYLKAWQTLSDEARQLLQAMPLIAETGGRPEQMQEISGLSEGQLWPAITQLAARSLIEVRGTAWERRYGIHRLTETFLYTEIIDWDLSKL